MGLFKEIYYFQTELAEALEINLSQKQSIIEDLEARIENLEEVTVNDQLLICT